MLTQVADGVLVHQSEFLQSNAVVVDGPGGAVLIDPGIRTDEITCIAGDLRESGRVVVAGFATHPHWDHVLWHADLGDVPRYGTERCASAMRDLLADPDWTARLATVLPPEMADAIPMDRFGLITPVPAETTRIPWDGPAVRLIEHRAHVAGHAALWVEERGVLVAGDMLSDALMPFLDLSSADPAGDYLAALELFERVAGGAEVVVPGHGTIGGAAEMRARIKLDRAYVEALRAGHDSHDPRLEPSAVHGAWLPGVDAWQRQQLAEKQKAAVEPA